MNNILHNVTTQNDSKYLFIVIILVLILFLIHLFVYHKKKRKLQYFMDDKIKTFKHVFNITQEAILILSYKNEIIYANQPMIELLGLKDDFLLKILPVPEVKIQKNWQKLDRLIKKTMGVVDKMQTFEEAIFLAANGKEEIPVNLYLTTSYIDVEYKKPCTTIVLDDLRKRQQKEFVGGKHKLTNLPNQAQAVNDLNAIYAKLHLEEQRIAVVVMNIDNFSTLRSIVGYEQSNLILIKFAKYLEELSQELSFMVYHTTHNNFLFVIQNIDSPADILSIVNQIQDKLTSFYKMESSMLHLTASVGIAIYPDNSKTLNLLDNAYKALAQAERNGHGRIEIYISKHGQHAYDELKLYNDMHEALKKNEFEVYYQPIISSNNREVIAAEALIRWHHPQHGMIMPDIFIPIMEKTGLIVELGEYVLEEVLKQQKRWELFKFRQIEVSINLSLIELEQGNFVEHVSRQLSHHKVAPSLIKFEVTEGIAMISEEQTSKQFLELKKLGVDISLDDFGTGYTSFSYLKKIPASYLKIDRSLVWNIVTNKEDQRIVKAMIELGHNLGMKIIVEGIEDKEMFTMIAEFGSDLMQGYYFAKPLPVFEFQKLLR